MSTVNSILFTIFTLASYQQCVGQEFDPDESFHHFNPPVWHVVSPQSSPCVTDRGFYGRTAKYDQRIYYRYELFLREGAYVSNATARTAGSGQQPPDLQGVLSAIETKIADSLLASNVFDSVCKRSQARARGPYQSGGGYRRLLRAEISRNMRAVGISSSPDDQVLEGLTCQKFLDANPVGPCFVVDGELNIFLDIYQELGPEVQSILVDLMNNQTALDDVHPYIEKVRYIKVQPDSATGGNSEKVGGTQTQKNANTPLSGGIYAVIAAAGALVVLTGVVYRRRRRTATDGETTLDPASGSIATPQESR